MARLDEGVRGHLMTASGVALSLLLLRRIASNLPPDVRSLAASGLRLFVEAEFEMQDGIIAKLAQKTVEALINTIPDGEPVHTADTTRSVLRNFERTARARSERQAWHHQDRNARYRHHVRKLKAAMAHASRHLSPAQQTYLAQATQGITEDW